MSEPTIQISFTPAAQAVLAKFEKLPKTVLRAIAKGSDEANQYTIGVIQKQFLSYPKDGPTTLEGLRAVSTRLRQSVRASKSVISGDAVVTSIGSNIKYAAVHEFGFQGSVMVGAHKRQRHAWQEFLKAPEKVKFKAPKRLKKESKSDYEERLSDALSAASSQSLGRAADRKTQMRQVRVGDVNVVAHERKMNMPARAFVRRGIIRNMETIKQTVSRHIIAAAGGAT